MLHLYPPHSLKLSGGKLKQKCSDERYPNFRFNLEEFAGALGDSLTAIPIVIGIAIVTGANLAYILLFFGIFQIVTGLYYR